MPLKRLLKIDFANITFVGIMVDKQRRADGVAYVVLHSMVVDEMGGYGGKLLDFHLNCLLCAYVISLKHGIFTHKNISKYKKYSEPKRRQAISELLKTGMIMEIPYDDVVLFARGYPLRQKKGGNAKYFRITKQGELFLEDYFSKYEQIQRRLEIDVLMPKMSIKAKPRR